MGGGKNKHRHHARCDWTVREMRLRVVWDFGLPFSAHCPRIFSGQVQTHKSSCLSLIHPGLWNPTNAGRRRKKILFFKASLDNIV